MEYRVFPLVVVCHVNLSCPVGRGALQLPGRVCKDVDDEGCSVGLDGPILLWHGC